MGMLTLSRKAKEEIVIRVPGIADPITLTVVRIKGKDVKLGFQADRSIIIHRREVDDAIRDGVPVPSADPFLPGSGQTEAA